MTTPTDRFGDFEIENPRPAGGEQSASNLKPISEKPGPTANDFGGCGRRGKWIDK